MATVLLNPTNKLSILNKGRALFDKQWEEANKPLPAEWGVTCYERIVAIPYGAAMNAVPREFFEGFTSIAVKLDGLPNGVTNTYEFPFPGAMRFPYQLPPEDHVVNTKSYSSVLSNSFRLPDTPEWADLRQAAVDRFNRIIAVRDERETFVNGVQKVLDAYKTLAPALRAWPPLWDILPVSMQEKHKEIVERAKPEKVEITHDISELTGVVVRSKILKGEN